MRGFRVHLYNLPNIEAGVFGQDGNFEVNEARNLSIIHSIFFEHL